MHICLTELKSGFICTVEHTLILTTRRVEDPPRVKGMESTFSTHVITGMQGPNGLQAFHVVESPEEIGRRCNLATYSLLSLDVGELSPDLLGYKETN